MIFVNKKITEDDFVTLLETTKVDVIKKYSGAKIKAISGTDFEEEVYDKMVLASENTDFAGDVVRTGTYTFPDIVAKKLYGVEVKMTIGDKWISTGNSVLESTRVESVKTIYMFFGKFGNDFSAKYRKYEDCLFDVGVTHSPRYKIDMDLPQGESIFSKMGVSYNIFRNEVNPIKRLKDYYRAQLQEGQELWWIDPAQDQMAVSPIIQSLSRLDITTRNNFITECFILFPEIFGSSNLKFERAAAYLITHYNAVSSNLRDSFTAGGRVDLRIDGKKVNVSRVLYNLYCRANEVEKRLNEIPHETLKYYWGHLISLRPLKIWKHLLKESATDSVDPLAVFNQGLIDQIAIEQKKGDDENEGMIAAEEDDPRLV
jgi:hypothetical protein